MTLEISNLIDPPPLRPWYLRRRTNPKWPRPAGWGFTIAIVIIGYLLLGPLPALLFAGGYVGGLILWLAIPSRPSFHKLRWPYFVTLLSFVAHKFEERHYGFFPALSEITGVPTPDADAILAKLLYAMAAAWLLIPVLVKCHHPFGYYLAWTFFASMGITELAHFVFPFIATGSPGYFPGLATAVVLAPAGWWGLWRMWRSRIAQAPPRPTAGTQTETTLSPQDP